MGHRRGAFITFPVFDPEWTLFAVFPNSDSQALQRDRQTERQGRGLPTPTTEAVLTLVRCSYVQTKCNTVNTREFKRHWPCTLDRPAWDFEGRCVPCMLCGPGRLGPCPQTAGLPGALDAVPVWHVARCRAGWGGTDVTRVAERFLEREGAQSGPAGSEV